MSSIIHTEKAPGAIGPYVQGRRVGNLIFTSGQLGIEDVITGELADGISAQAHASMKNLGEILKAAGADYSNIVKATIFVTDLGDFGTVNEIYASYFSGEYPARSCVQVAALPKSALVEIECIAEIG